MKIVVVGMGYVGTPVAALFADVPGVKVTGIQRRSKRSEWKIDALNEGKSIIDAEEPGFPELLKRVHDKGTFHVTDDPAEYRDADAILIAVQTPTDDDHVPRYESLRSVLAEIGSNLRPGTLVSLESTVAPGTTNYLAKPILEEKSGLKAGADFNLCFSYERVMVGRLLHNLTMYDRIVGGITPRCAERGVELYKKIVKSKVHPTDALTAEVSKVVENTYRDVNIAFANEVALICESLGVNFHNVRRFVNNLPNDPSNPGANPIRNLHNAGAGVGGHCLPKDSWLLKYGLDTYGSTHFTPHITIQSRLLNNRMPAHMVELAREALGEHGLKLKQARVTILGYAFLENSDDPRNTPSEPLYRLLDEIAQQVTVHDPLVKQDETDIPLMRDLEASVRGSDCVLIATRHREYTTLKPEWFKKLMRTPIIIDGRNTLSQKDAEAHGVTFRGIGLPKKAD